MSMGLNSRRPVLPWVYVRLPHPLPLQRRQALLHLPPRALPAPRRQAPPAHPAQPRQSVRHPPKSTGAHSARACARSSTPKRNSCRGPARPRSRPRPSASRPVFAWNARRFNSRELEPEPSRGRSRYRYRGIAGAEQKTRGVEAAGAKPRALSRRRRPNLRARPAGPECCRH